MLGNDATLIPNLVFRRLRLPLVLFWSCAVLADANQASPEVRRAPIDTAINRAALLDSVPVSVNSEYCPAYKYKSAVSVAGEVVTIRIPSPCYWDELPSPVGLSILHDNNNMHWKPIALQGLATRRGLLDLQVLFDQSGELALVWKGESETGDTIAEVSLYLSWHLTDAQWSPPVKLTDSEAEGIAGFIAFSPQPGRLELLWTDHREKHLKWPGGPMLDGIPKVFGRTVDMHELGPVVRVDGKRGRYSVGNRISAVAHSSGTIYSVWRQDLGKTDEGIFLAMKKEAEWEPPIRVSEWKPRGAKIYFGEAGVVARPGGGSDIFWLAGRSPSEIRHREFVNGVLSPVKTIGSGIADFDIAASSDGTIHMIYLDEISPLENGRWRPTLHRHRLYYRVWNGQGWSAVRTVARGVFWGTTQIEVDGLDQVHLFWQEIVGKQATLRYLVMPPSSVSRNGD